MTPANFGQPRSERQIATESQWKLVELVRQAVLYIEESHCCAQVGDCDGYHPHDIAFARELNTRLQEIIRNS